MELGGCTDQELVQRWRDGDEAARDVLLQEYNDFFDLYLRPIARYAPEDIHEAKSLALERLWRSVHTREIRFVDQSLKQYAKAIARSAVMDVYRARRQRPTVSLDGDEADGTAESRPPDARVTEHAAQSPLLSEHVRGEIAGHVVDALLAEEDLLRTIGRMLPDDAAILKLTAQGHTLPEICEILGISYSAAASRLSRARSRLRERLGT